jgi:hypothetical protein
VTYAYRGEPWWPIQAWEGRLGGSRAQDWWHAAPAHQRLAPAALWAGLQPTAADEAPQDPATGG